MSHDVSGWMLCTKMEYISTLNRIQRQGVDCCLSPSEQGVNLQLCFVLPLKMLERVDSLEIEGGVLWGKSETSQSVLIFLFTFLLVFTYFTFFAVHVLPGGQYFCLLQLFFLSSHPPAYMFKTVSSCQRSL